MTVRRWPNYSGEPEDLTVRQAADRLHLSPSAVRRRIHVGHLYAYRVDNRLLLPPWQFHADTVLPCLPEVLAALPDDAHPMTLAGFMTLPSDECDDLSPAEWLSSGLDLERVRFAATALSW